MFRALTDKVYASPQIGLADVAEAKALGVGLIVNNRPEGESDDQPPGAEIERAAREAGIDYAAIPVTHSGFSHSQLDAFNHALERAGAMSNGGKVLAFCRSGTRSTFLWALARAKAGDDPQQIARKAAAVGYDLTPILPYLRG